MKKRYLFILSLFCLGIYGLTQFSTYAAGDQFSTVLLQLDTTQVNRVIITPSATKNQIQFYRLPDLGWQVTSGNVSTPALIETVNDLLVALNNVQTTRVVTNQETDWEDYGVGEEALQIEIITQDDQIERIIVGGRAHLKAAMIDTTFARIPNENEVYALKQFTRQIFTHPFHFYRQRKVLQIDDYQEVNRVVLEQKDTLLRTKEGWKSTIGRTIDSTQLSNYFAQLNYLEGSYFADDFDETQIATLPHQELMISGDNINPTVQVKAYFDSTATLPFIIQSSQFPTIFYASDSSGIYQKLFGIFADSMQFE
ncbi:MAG: DUF4340 domain-containing protein [Saprospiraceae bacterium]